MQRLVTLLHLALLAALLRTLLVEANNLGTTVRNQMLDLFAGGTSALIPPANLYLSWDTTVYDQAGGTGVAVTTGQVTSVARLTVAPSVWGAASAGSKANTTAITGLQSAGGSGATVLGASYWSASTVGTIFMTITLGSSFSYANGVQPVVAIGSATIAIT